MVIVAECRTCGQQYALPPDAAGQTKTCRICSGRLVIPGPRITPHKGSRAQEPISQLAFTLPQRRRWLDGRPSLVRVIRQLPRIGWVLTGAIGAVLLFGLFRFQPISKVPRHSTDSPHPLNSAPRLDTESELLRSNDVQSRQLGVGIYEDAAAIVTILNYQNSRISGHGTGFFLSPGDVIITNTHVLGLADYVIVETYWGRRLKIDKVLAYNIAADVAILPVPVSFEPDSLKLADRAHALGERVFAIGSPSAATHN